MTEAYYQFSQNKRVWHILVGQLLKYQVDRLETWLISHCPLEIKPSWLKGNWDITPRLSINWKFPFTFAWWAWRVRETFHFILFTTFTKLYTVKRRHKILFWFLTLFSAHNITVTYKINLANEDTKTQYSYMMYPQSVQQAANRVYQESLIFHSILPSTFCCCNRKDNVCFLSLESILCLPWVAHWECYIKWKEDSKEFNIWIFRVHLGDKVYMWLLWLHHLCFPCRRAKPYTILNECS